MEAVRPPDRGNLYIDFVAEFITPGQWCRICSRNKLKRCIKTEARRIRQQDLHSHYRGRDKVYGSDGLIGESHYAAKLGIRKWETAAEF